MLLFRSYLNRSAEHKCTWLMQMGTHIAGQYNLCGKQCERLRRIGKSIYKWVFKIMLLYNAKSKWKLRVWKVEKEKRRIQVNESFISSVQNKGKTNLSAKPRMLQKVTLSLEKWNDESFPECARPRNFENIIPYTMPGELCSNSNRKN